MLPVAEFRHYIAQHALFEQGERILLAVSGGKDSVVMAHLFKKAGFNIGIAHCNFKLRADESTRDELFVKELCKTLDVPFYVTHFDTNDFASAHKISTQMAARQLRYTWFEELRKRHNYAYIAVAQHQNDAIETLLLNLTRGTGISGLHGILPKRDFIIRPLLFLTRDAIDELIATEGFPFVEDSSNASAKYARNKIRLNVIPQLKALNPKLELTFAQNMVRFAELEHLLQVTVEQHRKTIFNQQGNLTYLNIARIRELDPQRTLLFELLRPYHFTETVVDDILSCLNQHSGPLFDSPTHQLILDREYLILTAKRQDFDEALINEQNTLVTFGNRNIKIRYGSSVDFNHNRNTAFVDADKLVFPLKIRQWQTGDKFVPLGMKGFKKLSDVFIDAKIPINEKNNTPVLLNGNNDIIWIAGLRMDNRYKLTEDTKKVIIFELES